MKYRECMETVEVDGARIILIDHMGSDLSVVNAARVSFGKWREELDSRDIKLIHYLAKNKHMSPFRHVCFSFLLEGVSEVLCRQLYKHQVGCAYTSGEFRETATVWNEVSGRYVEFDPEFYIPEGFREQSQNNKQASLREVFVENQKEAQEIYQSSVQKSFEAYQDLLKLGVCREQARMVIPLSFRNSLIWTASLEAVAHFIRLRKHPGAQVEMQRLAEAIEGLVHPYCPESLSALGATIDSGAHEGGQA
jgi:thymidylate synthase (FAD)